MNIRIFITTLFLMSCPFLGHCQMQYYWGNNQSFYSSTTQQIVITAKKIDTNKNTYIVGYFNPGNFIISGNTYTNLGTQDGFLVKLDKNGVPQWHCVLLGTGSDEIDDVVLDDNENPVILGFVGTTGANLKNQTGTIKSIPSNGSTYSPFILKLNKNNGQPWNLHYLITGTGSITRTSNLYISNSELYITGMVKGVNFKVGTGTTQYTSNTTGTKYDLFIIKADTSLNVSIFKQIPTTSNASATRFNSLNKTSNGFYFTGTINNTSITFTLSSGNRTVSNSIAFYDFFTYYTDLSLNGQWALQSIGYSNHSKLTQGASLDNEENLYITGYNQSSSFNLETIYTTGTVSTKLISNHGAAGTSDGFILKYDQTGKLLASKILGDSYNQMGYDIQPFGNKIVQSGYFNGSIIWGKDTLKSSSTTDQDGYLALFDTTNLTPIGAVQIKGTGTENAEKFYYNGSDFNPIIGTLASTAASSVTLKTAGGDVVLTNTAGKSIYVANACPIIGIFENPTTTNLYVDPSKPQTGTIELDVKGDVLGGYSYQWSKKGVDFSRSSSLTDLGPDTTYTVRVDYLGSKCSKTRSFTVLRSITEKSTASINSTSCAAKDGSITAVVTNNTNGKYTVVEASIDSATWFTGTQSGNDYTFKFTGLTKGDYQLYYRLTVGASMYHSLLGTKIFINEAGNLITWNSTTVNPIRCNGNTGSITVSASTTSGSLTYSVTTSSTPNYIAQNSYSNLTAGTYYINITDGVCQYRAAAVNLTNPAPLTINSSTNISTCYSGTNGGISVKAEGGTPSYQYQLTDGVTTTAFQPSNVFSGLAESTNYTVTVKDVYGCTYTTPAINLESLTSSLSISPTSIVSHYYNSIIPGKIIIIPQGGINSTFTYNINPTDYTQTQSNFENLLPNNYNITILHNAGCSYSELFTIKDLNQAYPLVYRKPN